MKYKTYIYGLHQDDKLIYVGKTNGPKGRLYSHRGTYKGKLHMIILDIYEDLELLWVDKMKEEGHELKNKEDNSSNGENGWKIGDKVETKDLPRTRYTVRDTELDILYSSLSEFQRATGIGIGTLQYQLNKSTNPKECYKKYVIINN